MTHLVAKPNRFDPYKNFKFRVKFGISPDYVAGISKVGALKRTTEMVEHREGGDPSTSRKSPGRTKYEPITLERGVSHDPEFEEWANKVWNFEGFPGAESSLADFRKDIIIDVFNEAGQKVISTRSTAAGCRSTRPFPIWTPTPMRWRSRPSNWRTRAGYAIPSFKYPMNRPLSSPGD